MVAGIAIIVMGLHFLGVFRIGLLYREARLSVRQAGRAVGRLCDGPCLRLRLDALHRPDPGRDPGRCGLRRRASARGAFLLAVYSAGLGLPFIARRFRHDALRRASSSACARRFPYVEKAMGALLVLTGIAFLNGWIADASFWLLETFPALGRLG